MGIKCYLVLCCLSYWIGPSLMFDKSTYTGYESEGSVEVTLSLRNGYKVKGGFNVTVVSTDDTAFGKFVN